MRIDYVRSDLHVAWPGDRRMLSGRDSLRVYRVRSTADRVARDACRRGVEARAMQLLVLDSLGSAAQWVVRYGQPCTSPLEVPVGLARVVPPEPGGVIDTGGA